MIAKFRYHSKNTVIRYHSENIVIAKIVIFAMIANFRYPSENTVIAKIEIFSMHSNFRYDSENSSVAKFWHCSSLFHCFMRLLFPLHYSISSCFNILHSRLVEIDKKYI